MVTKLIGRTGAVAGMDFVMPENFSVLRIGASAASEIRIRADGVSKEHARIVRRANECWVEDAGSRNGTFINGLRLKEERLRHLDVITLARRVDLIFVETNRETPAEPPPGVLSASLEVTSGPTAGTKMDIPAGELTIGRAASANVRFNHPSVGKAHARLVRTDSQLTIEDLKSANGTFVNDRKITLEVLKNGDRISLGGVAQFRIVLLADLGAGMPVTPSADTRVEPAFTGEWQTRVLWSPKELDAIARNPEKALDMMERPASGDARTKAQAPPVARKTPSAASPLPAPVTSLYVPPEAPQPPASPRKADASAAAIRSVELLGGPDGKVILGAGEHKFGRQSTAEVHLPDGDREASRIHAVLIVAPDRAFVEDRSVNGTFVNGERLTQARILSDGDKIRCGSATFTVRLVR